MRGIFVKPSAPGILLKPLFWFAATLMMAVAMPACRAADPPDALAQFRIGYAYERGDGMPKDYAEAMRLYRLSAAQGNSVAQFRIGYLYERGLGVVRDYAEAMRDYRVSAAQGNAVAQFRIDYLYENGWGVVQDDAQAMQWYDKAASQGNQPAAASRLAVLKAKHP